MSFKVSTFGEGLAAAWEIALKGLLTSLKQ
jgi:hypothetical protein